MRGSMTRLGGTGEEIYDYTDKLREAQAYVSISVL